MGVKKYCSEVIKEGKRVRWPKWDDFFPTLVVVIIICTIAAIFLSLEDWAAASLINQLKDIFGTLSTESSSSDSSDTALTIIRLLLGGF